MPPSIQNNSSQWLLCECDKNAIKALKTIENRNRMTNIKFYGNNALMKDNIILSRDMKKAIRIKDAWDYEMNQAKAKLKQNVDAYNIEAWNSFNKGEVTMAMIKYDNRINPYELCVLIINNN